jgi:3-oxoacyl-[acyl-carrier-protein] synthase-3
LPRVKIISTGSYVPEQVLTNQDLERIVDTSDDWITERTGIKERRIGAADQCSSDLALEASKMALKRAGLKPKDLDLIILATVTPDMPLPSTACMLQAKLGAANAAAFDINAACSGFIYALSTAEAFIKSGKSKKVLVCGAEMLSRITDYEDRSTCILFGDGAGAAVLAPSTGGSGLLSIKIYSDGTQGDLLSVPAGGSMQPASRDTLRKRLHFVKMKGNETFKLAVKTLETIVMDTLKEQGLKPSDLSLLIPHQANLRIIKATAERLKLPPNKVVTNLQRFGNTSAASIPIALDEACCTGRIRPGDYIMMEAFGGGLTWGSALARW